MSNKTINYKAKTTKDLVIMLIGKVNHVCDNELPSIDRHLKAQNDSITNLKSRVSDIEKADAIAEAIKTSKKSNEESVKQDRRITDERRYRYMKLALLFLSLILSGTTGVLIHELLNRAGG